MTEIYKRTSASVLPHSPTTQATSYCKKPLLNVLPAQSMILPTFLITILLLGYSQATTFKAQSDEPPKKPFLISFDPGFEVTVAKLGDTDIMKCAGPVPLTKTLTPCYKQTMESTVKIIIADKRKWAKAQFLVGTEIFMSFSMENLAPNKLDPVAVAVVDSNKLQNDALHLPFQPTGMQLIPKKNTSDGEKPQNGGEHTEVGSGKGEISKGGATNSVSVTKKCSEQLADSDNCFEVVTAEYPVFVSAEMSSTRQVLTLTGEGQNNFQVTIFQGSAATWLSHSVALILANLAIVYFAY